MKKEEDIVIERMITNKNGDIIALDIHDEDKGEAVYLESVSRHYHGKYDKEIKKLGE